MRVEPFTSNFDFGTDLQEATKFVNQPNPRMQGPGYLKLRDLVSPNTSVWLCLVFAVFSVWLCLGLCLVLASSGTALVFGCVQVCAQLCLGLCLVCLGCVCLCLACVWLCLVLASCV